MNIQLLEKTCLSCGVKLTEFEVEEKNGYCIDCFQEVNEENKELITK
ncbi:hypothetical protein [Ammoniphilus sp. CFH 90114]|nr:hypothetical protein [Ammoniphilus sp. CFH 90114]